MQKKNNMDMEIYQLITGRSHPDLTEYEGYHLHKEALDSFQNLQLKAKKEIGTDLKMISSFRDFNRQLQIWNNKSLGKTAIKDDDGKILDIKDLDSIEVIKKIMRFSALPGASRHHWGTDFDIYDANKISKDKVQLEPHECSPTGVCGKLHLWLDEIISSNDSFGFFRPYDKDLGGVSIEKWHISYKPLSEIYFSAYTKKVFQKNIEESEVELKSTILEHLDEIFENFVVNISK